jgi:hypothetical protein
MSISGETTGVSATSFLKNFVIRNCTVSGELFAIRASTEGPGLHNLEILDTRIPYGNGGIYILVRTDSPLIADISRNNINARNVYPGILISSGSHASACLNIFDNTVCAGSNDSLIIQNGRFHLVDYSPYIGEGINDFLNRRNNLCRRSMNNFRLLPTCFGTFLK